MKICIGTANGIKIDALKETIAVYDFLAGATVVGVDVPSGVADQPKSLAETIRGAKNRAKAVFECCPGSKLPENQDNPQRCDLAVGIEDGLMPVPETSTGHMNIGVCAIYDGREYYLGLASAFEYPAKVTKYAIDDGLDINKAFYKAGLTVNEKIGSFEGAIGVLTKGKITRKEHAKSAIRMALVKFENKSLY